MPRPVKTVLGIEGGAVIQTTGGLCCDGWQAEGFSLAAAVIAGRALARAVHGNGTLVAVGLVAVGLVAVVAAVIFVLHRVHRSLPASLLAVSAATVIAQATGPDVARIGTLPASLPSRRSRRCRCSGSVTCSVPPSQWRR